MLTGHVAGNGVRVRHSRVLVIHCHNPSRLTNNVMTVTCPTNMPCMVAYLAEALFSRYDNVSRQRLVEVSFNIDARQARFSIDKHAF